MAQGWNDTVLNAMAAAANTLATHASIHTAEPNASGSNESAAARQPVDWATPTGGDSVLDSELAFTGGTPNGAATHIGFWDDDTAGNFLGYWALSGDQTFNAAGEYTVPSGTVAGSSS